MPTRLKEPRFTQNGNRIVMPRGFPKELRPYFKEIVKDLRDLGLESSSDVSVVKSLAIQMKRRDDLTLTILKEGETFTTSDGTVRKHPASSLLNDVVSSILRISANMGLDPRSRLILLGETNKEREPADINEMLRRMAQ